MDIDHHKKVIKIPTPKLGARQCGLSCSWRGDMGVDMGYPSDAPPDIPLRCNNLYLCAIIDIKINYASFIIHQLMVNGTKNNIYV